MARVERNRTADASPARRSLPAPRGIRRPRGFRRLDEAGDGRVAARPASLPASQQGALAVGHQHDDRRIDARKEFVRIAIVGAANHVTGALGSSAGAAHSAETLPAAPDRQGPRVGQQARLVRGQQR